jgi:hypothetical protein
VTRARREFADQSAVGFMMTATKRDLVDSVAFLPSSAVTGGIDYDWRLGRRFNVAGMFAGSAVRGSTEAITALQESNVHAFQRPDADHLEVDPLATGMNGYAGYVSLNKIGGERVRGYTFFRFQSPGFDYNDLGFQRRADERGQGNWVQLRFERPGTHVRSFRINFNQHNRWNFAGERLWSGANVNAHWEFQNNWSSGGGTFVSLPGFDDRATRGGPGAATTPRMGQFFYVQSDDRRLVSGGVFGFWEADREGSRIYEVNPSATVRPTSALSVQVGWRVSENTDDAQWVEKVDEGDRSHYVFGRLRQTTVALTSRVNYTVTPALSLQLYAEPFVSAGRYEHYKELADGRAEEYANRYRPFAYAGNADFNVLSFRTTNVLRWEYRPGSALFVVWQQGRGESGDRGDFRFGRDFRDVFTTPATNTLLVKLSYWLNL